MWLQFAALSAALAQPIRIWPRQITVDNAKVTVYQPQAISWPDHKELTARAALSITPPHVTTPILGTIDVTLATATDTQTGTVHLSDPKLIASHFPTLNTQQATDLETKIRADLNRMEITAVPLDSVLLSLKEQPNASVPVDNTPPVIFYSTRPASLVVFGRTARDGARRNWRRDLCGQYKLGCIRLSGRLVFTKQQYLVPGGRCAGSLQRDVVRARSVQCDLEGHELRDRA